MTLQVTDATPSDQDYHYVSCYAEYREAASAAWDGPLQVDAYGSAPDLTSSDPSITITSTPSLLTVPVVAFADVPAGTYDVRIACNRTPDATGLVLIAGFTVVATDR